MGKWTDLVIFEHHTIIKSLFWLGVIFAIPILFCGGLDSWATGYDQAHQVRVATPMITPSLTAQIGGLASPTPGPAEVDETITVDTAALKGNVQYPTDFVRDPSTDPVGTYYAELNFGNGPFPGVYIVPDIWEQAGGRVVVTSNMPTSGFYYTVFTNQGTSTQVIYDKIHNTVYSMEANPEVMDAT